ncbi:MULTISPECIES: type II toxin-antitoxin system MqsR family toxin [Pseudomonas]|jgi:motility quorum-sensing regulator/GCU-specific mRNA interferase toxin|uniref:Type II toxin-antitoxin system MqsR family toxin n=1 Tax=Pseudomonas putida TaxID=303 RepID=A0A7Y7ZE22_PSEPU|nr:MULTISPECIES: type II toxin-antitoxin system MqsR family toxin [Pseudomonas]QPN43897.1 type II toxin-antitoxin system MqsR family toxin [Priestia aryabhattai]KAF1305573.1 mRNA interferase MqsR [Pseudomonas sp. SG-MS2]MBG6127136.1 motility quorum-sensing regulator/GCU-specific mRNA interferase toxin [Pseudomonas sp. M2]MBM7396907.1 motility quorum-sensing regulator/GCU-specific mRNA interferase toxin [Pseudomonas sp. M5]NSX22751.1 type II toxin-antitoxin system MqsR family toxin [Pseudomonas
MEKRTPHCSLERIRALVSAGRISPTTASLRGAQALGMDYPDMLEIINGLERRDFHKSMTCHGDYRVWQDVYRPLTGKGYVYLKLSVVDDVLIVSFKEL